MKTLRRKIPGRVCPYLVWIFLLCSLRGEDRPLVIQNVTVVDVRTGQLQGPASLIVRGSRIAHIAWDDQLDVPAGAQVLAAKGKFLIPGLIDMHVHYRDWVPELFVNHGVTSVRDMANQVTWLLALQQAWRTGLLDAKGVDWFSRAGPRLFVAGVINTYPNGASHHYQATSVEDARRAVSRMLMAGVDGGFKLHDGTSLEMLEAVSRSAHQLGEKATAHLTKGMTVAQAVGAGIDGIEHSRYDFSRASIELMLRQGVYWTPMLMGDWMDVVGVAEADADYVQRLLKEPGLAYLPEMRRKILKAVYPSGGRSSLEQGERVLRFHSLLPLIREFVNKGGKLLAGCSTYFLSGFALHQELALLVEEVGLTPLQALQSATLNAAEYLGRTDLGTIQEGSLADLLILDENPLEDIRHTRQIALVLLAGRVVSDGYHADFIPLLVRPVLPNSRVFYGQELLAQ